MSSRSASILPLLLSFLAVGACTPGGKDTADTSDTADTAYTADTADTSDTGGDAIVTDVDVAVSYTCPYGDVTLADTVVLDTLDSCIYREDPGTFNVGLISADGAGGVFIDGFTGVGTYTTGSTEDSTYVYLRGPADGDTAPGQVSSWGDPAWPCEVKVTAETVTTSVGGTGGVVVEVYCEALGAVAADAYTCTLTPPDFSFSVAGCEASPN